MVLIKTLPRQTKLFRHKTQANSFSVLVKISYLKRNSLAGMKVLVSSWKYSFSFSSHTHLSSRSWQAIVSLTLIYFTLIWAECLKCTYWKGAACGSSQRDHCSSVHASLFVSVEKVWLGFKPRSRRTPLSALPVYFYLLSYVAAQIALRFNEL